jgi:hypothetical protein
MKLEFLPDGSPDCPLLRLYAFTTSEARRLGEAIAELASGASDCVEIHHLPWVKSIGDCRLTLVVRPWDQGIVGKGGPEEFECGLTAVTWDNVAGLIAPFADGGRGYQWLAGTPGTSLLLSVDGQW